MAPARLALGHRQARARRTSRAGLACIAGQAGQAGRPSVERLRPSAMRRPPARPLVSNGDRPSAAPLRILGLLKCDAPPAARATCGPKPLRLPQGATVGLLRRPAEPYRAKNRSEESSRKGLRHCAPLAMKRTARAPPAPGGRPHVSPGSSASSGRRGRVRAGSRALGGADLCASTRTDAAHERL